MTLPLDPPDPRPGPPSHHRHPGDGWVECSCGRRHWGLHGAAGLFLGRRGPDGDPSHVLLQHRAPWSDQGGLWGVPGGALAPGESAVAAALREAQEEAGVGYDHVEILGEHVLDHGTWRYTTLVARVADGRHIEPIVADAESIEIRWVALDDVAGLPLVPAFADAWQTLRDVLFVTSPGREDGE